MIVHNLPHSMQAIAGSGETVPVTTVRGIPVNEPKADGVLLRVYGDNVTITTDGRVPVAGSVGREYEPGYDLYISTHDAYRLQMISAGTSSVDIESVKIPG